MKYFFAHFAQTFVYFAVKLSEPLINLINLIKMKKLITLLLLLLPAFALQAQDSIKNEEEANFDKFMIKVSPVTILQGELPIVIEYRPLKHLGIQLSGGYVFLNPLIATGKTLCSGYKLTGGLRIYFNEGEMRNRTWFLNPQFFYKYMWITDRTYNENTRIFGGGSDRPETYDYNEIREVLCIELLTGFIKKYDFLIFEMYFGGGVRSVNSDRYITKWEIYKHESVNQYNYEILNPPNEINRTFLSASLQIGVNLSFPIRKCHKVPSKAKPRW
jgi:hypothetical protein